MTRQAQYLFVAPLAQGKVVLEVGAGDGSGARFLAEHGATRVIGIDGDRDTIVAARALHSLSNLELRHEHPAHIELEDASIGCVFVPDGASLLRRRGVLAEIRRVLMPGGPLVVTAAAAERPGAVGGATFHELVERLTPLFGPVRMVAQGSVHAIALVGFADAADDSEDIPSVVLDRSLADGPLAVTHYVAVCGAESLDASGLSLIEMPGAIAREVTVVGAGDAGDDGVPRAARADERTARVVDLAQVASTGPPEVPDVVAEHAARIAELEAELELERARAEEFARALDAQTGDLQGRLSHVEARRTELEHNLEEAEEERARLEAKVALAEAAAEDMGKVLSAVGGAAVAAPVVTGEVSPLGIAALRRVEAELAAVRSLLQPLETGLQQLEDGLTHAAQADDVDAERRMRQMAMEIGIKEAEMTLLNIGLSTLQRRLKDVVETARTTRHAMQDRSAAEMLDLMDGLQRALSALA